MFSQTHHGTSSVPPPIHNHQTRTMIICSVSCVVTVWGTRRSSGNKHQMKPCSFETIVHDRIHGISHRHQHHIPLQNHITLAMDQWAGNYSLWHFFQCSAFVEIYLICILNVYIYICVCVFLYLHVYIYIYLKARVG